MAGDMKSLLLKHLEENGAIDDSEVLAKEKGWDHDKLVGAIKSVQAEEMISTTSMKREGLKLTAEGESAVQNGAPEVQVFNFVKSKGSCSSADVDAAVGASAKAGTSTAMKNKWISIDKSKAVTTIVDSVADELKADLTNLAALDKAKLDALKKRKMIAPTSVTAFKVEKTEKFSVDAQKAVADITAEMISKGTWSSTKFKPFNFENASGLPCTGGHLHPLNKVKTEMRNVLMLMGFEEMKTNQWVESSFWNFDSLFQPQQHPARDAHDTFFMEAPSRAQNIPAEYLQRVKEMHEKGGGGSVGWRYDWSEDEAKKNLLRTHTTAVSARTLYAMGQEYQKTGVFRPKKHFSIDRVFRNETLDATHLAEFHQVEGFVADRNIGLPQLIGVLRDFFARVGISKLRFKPAYNPYTEPSMEIFGFHPILKKWIEVGNSGVFRPEMLLPMGLPEDVSVIAWGIGVERWAALLYNIRSIKELFSFQQDIAATKKNRVCWLKRAED
mmetsp:Transcript_101275/g.179958  ORF Transcript_101275/g.179958 Transcript_101275/m.179958 type:complete len:498 (+) Transcript_101275:73-1566(+)|eukprot:CAMPEP_0197656180 /NCGR_PEP_ID=MMETSP1338-20131121/40659_1 /TAXON_ID=43686 ORGANISM="Pelagodinium beii, Strain RCC1491" /NCGR_SAMPLE_ID=MMETSP1338 /ASSEMBLY_ACC=CAM_ASM_000754 /LENGTH=497 /DNA_ID=CAMNT_0043232055 /DNA_START=60 /DNA_END=1553 /DNA_ORIENTATION=-